MGSCNKQHTMKSYNKALLCCKILQRSNRQPVDTPKQRGAKITGQNLWEGYDF